MQPRPRRPLPAVLDWERAGSALRACVHHYASEPAFQAALLALYARHCAGREPFLACLRSLWDVNDLAHRTHGQWADEYLAALSDLACEWGLHRLRPLAGQAKCRFIASEGAELIHGWCSYRALGRLQGFDCPPEYFISGVSAGGGRPDIGEVVSTEILAAQLPDQVTVYIKDERHEPLIHVQVQGRWDPREEPKADAKMRLLAEAERQIEAELERIAKEAENLGYEFPDTSPRAAQHLRWLYEHVALGISYPDLAERDLKGKRDLAQTVANAAGHYARLLGVSLTDPPTPPV
jgi:hypothetical protein